MKKIIFLICLTFAFSFEWIEYNNSVIEGKTIILKFNNYFSPKLGIENPLEWDKLKVVGQFPQIQSFSPLFPTAKTQHHYEFELHQYYKIKLKDQLITYEIIKLFESISHIEKVELSYKNKMYITPNDPNYSNQWDHDNYGQVTNGISDADMDTNEAWDFTTGSNGVIIAILDTGIDLDHPDYADRVIPGYDFINNDTNASDDQGHGTSCAGIAGAEGNNNIGIAGICWECQLMPVKVLGSDGSGDDSGIAEAVTWATDSDAHVISMSLGGGMFVSYFDSAVDYATSNGTTVIAATGNDDFGSLSYPARYDNCIAIGAMSPCNERKDFSSCDGENFWGSNYGEGIDLVAPGVKIPATTNGGGYTTQFNGTSSACPHAAGVAGLIYSVSPGVNAYDVRTIMQVQADDIGSIGYDLETGYGRLNANKSVRNLLNTPDLVVSDTELNFIVELESTQEQYFYIGNAGSVDLSFNLNNDGYSWNESSNEHETNNWVDINNIGNAVTFQHNDQGVSNIPIGFDFKFYDEIYTSIIVNPNGWIGFGNDSDAWDNSGLPSNDAPKNAILGFWDDLNPVNNGCNSTCAGEVLYHSSPERFVVWFNDVIHWVTADYPNSTINFQFVLYPDGKVELNYSDISGPFSPTIGIQNNDATDAVLIAVYQNAEENLIIENNSSTWLYQFPSWLSVNTTSGNITGGNDMELIFTANSHNLSIGEYSSLFWLTTNDYNNQLIDIVVNLEISGEIEPCSGWIKGDLNSDGTINILDILRSVNIILGIDTEIEPCEVWSADYNMDDSVNVTDIISMVNFILTI
ncbi:MAG: S8 family serine peptidase [Candidatus Marinimicrobia bacterium]|nr:S8 family serine peptidase [Candidatus Neomarinimicrobiota bacterium]